MSGLCHKATASRRTESVTTTPALRPKGTHSRRMRLEFRRSRATPAQARVIRHETTHEANGAAFGAWLCHHSRALDFGGVVDACDDLFGLSFQFCARPGSERYWRSGRRAGVG